MHTLDKWETQNVEVDATAKAFTAAPEAKPRHYSLSLEAWSLWHQGQKLVEKNMV
jgi:hypothetical protein